MILTDSSAWIEFRRATGSAADQRVVELVSEGLCAWTEPIEMELVAGARIAADAEGVRRMLGTSTLIPFESPGDFHAAADIYRSCRRAGITPRGMVDCMIAAVGLRASTSVLTHDRDFALMASVVGLGLDRAALQA